MARFLRCFSRRRAIREIRNCEISLIGLRCVDVPDAGIKPRRRVMSCKAWNSPMIEWRGYFKRISRNQNIVVAIGDKNFRSAIIASLLNEPLLDEALPRGLTIHYAVEGLDSI